MFNHITCARINNMFRRRLMMATSSYNIKWETQTGTWIKSSLIPNPPSGISPLDGNYYTCVSPGSGGSTRLRCTFSGVSSITFYCISQGEASYDYLTIGELDSICERSSFAYTLNGDPNSWNKYTYAVPDSGTHYIEFVIQKILQ